MLRSSPSTTPRWATKTLTRASRSSALRQLSVHALASDSRLSASQCVGSLRRYVMDPHGVTGKVQALG